MAGLYVWGITLYAILVGCRSNVAPIPFLPKDYVKYMHPPTINGTPVIFSVNLEMFDVISISIHEGTIRADVSLEFNWRDIRLNVSDDIAQGKVRYILNPEESSSFWKPQILFNEMKMFSTDRGETQSKVMFLHGQQYVGYSVRAFLTYGCDFDFSMYPIDIQVCALNLNIVGPRAEEMELTWSRDSAVKRLEFALPLYNVRLCASPTSRIRLVAGGTKRSSFLRFYLVLNRLVKRHILQSYLPSTIFVIVSWGSFLVPPEVVPGRMVLLVTTLLSLITLFASSRSEIPPSLEINCTETWLLFCIIYVFLALCQYAFILYLGRTAPAPTNRSSDYLIVGPLYERPVPSKVLSEKEKKSGKNSSRMKRFLLSLKKLCRNPDKDHWSIQDRIALVVFPLSFITAAALYGYFVNRNLYEKNRGKLDEVEECFASYEK